MNESKVLAKYLSMSDKRYAEIEKMVLATYKNACIVWIEENENKDLLHKYEAYKSSFSEPNEKRLFHGTSKENIDSILQNGFNPECNTTSAHGRGTYFSRRAVYSKDYSLKHENRFRKKTSNSEGNIAYMFVCDVVTGKTTIGSQGTILPKGFDSFTDSISRPDMYIVNKLEACYPRYICAFYPYA